MSGPLSGTATAFFLYDVGDAIELAQVRTRIEAVPASFTTKSTAPSHIQYQQPPVVVDGATVQASPARDSGGASRCSLFIDVNELTDKAENALKFAGDVYFARVFALTAARLGLDEWKQNVREKLQTLDDIIASPPSRPRWHAVRSSSSRSWRSSSSS